MIKTSDVVHQFKHWRHTEATHTVWVLRGLIERGLSPRQSAVYNIICKNAPQGVLVESNLIAEKLSINVNHADNILGQLYDYGLLIKKPVNSTNGLCYQWGLYVD